MRLFHLIEFLFLCYLSQMVLSRCVEGARVCLSAAFLVQQRYDWDIKIRKWVVVLFVYQLFDMT